MKRILTLLLAALMLLSTACAAAKAPQAPETRTFTDSVGRTVAVPCTIDKVAVSGPLAQIVLFALCPDSSDRPLRPVPGPAGRHRRQMG